MSTTQHSQVLSTSSQRQKPLRMTHPLTLPTKAVSLKMKAGDVIAQADLLVCGDYFQSKLDHDGIFSY